MTKQAFISATFSNENVFTAATNRYINANYPALRHFYFHVPNESASGDLMRMKLSGMGVLPGVPDFVFVWPYLWFLELKQPKGVISPKQKDLHERWAIVGLTVHVARNGQEVCNILDKMF